MSSPEKPRSCVRGTMAQSQARKSNWLHPTGLTGEIFCHRRQKCNEVDSPHMMRPLVVFSLHSFRPDGKSPLPFVYGKNGTVNLRKPLLKRKYITPYHSGNQIKNKEGPYWRANFSDDVSSSLEKPTRKSACKVESS